MLSAEELEAIDDWRFRQRMPSRAAAIRQLLNAGLRVHQLDGAAKPMKSQSYGLLESPDSADED